MSLLDIFNNECGQKRFTFTKQPAKKVGLKYKFKFGKYKGFDMMDVLCKDKMYVKYLHEAGIIEFTKKDDTKLRSIIYGSQTENQSGII